MLRDPSIVTVRILVTLQVFLDSLLQGQRRHDATRIDHAHKKLEDFAQRGERFHGLGAAVHRPDDRVQEKSYEGRQRQPFGARTLKVADLVGYGILAKQVRR